MRSFIKMILHSLYGHLLCGAKKIIRFFHRMTSGLELNNVILFSSIPDFSDSTVEVFNLLTETDEFKEYTFIWFCDNPRKQRRLKRPRAVIKKRIDNPLFRLVNLYCESTAKCSIYTHQLLGNMYNEKQLRLHISHGSFGLKKHGESYARQMMSSAARMVETNNYGLDKLVACGLPRNDRLFDDPVVTRKKLGIESYSRIIVWLPTFKHYKFKGWFHPRRNDFTVGKEYDILLQSDNSFYVKMEEALKDHNILLIIKYHPGQDMKYVSSRETAQIRIMSDEYLSGLDVPLYSLLGATDALITDFSSVFADYLLINKPIGFDVADMESYSFVHEDPLAYMPGKKIRSVDDFRDFIVDVAEGRDGYEADRERMLNMVHIQRDNQSTKRVVEFLVSQLIHGHREGSA